MKFLSFYDTPYRKTACGPNAKAHILHSNECKTALFHPNFAYLYVVQQLLLCRNNLYYQNA